MTSMPTEFRFSSRAALHVVPEPTNGSSTQSPSSVKSLMNHSGSALGKAAECPLFPHSVAKCSTLLGYALSRFNQFAMFFPNPLPTLESNRTTSFLPKDFNRVSAHFPIGTITASWFILKFGDLLN